MTGVVVVAVGLLLAAAAAWQADPLWALIPAVLMCLFGLLLDDGGDQ